MKRIWSRSARTTISGADGPPPTAQNSGPTSQEIEEIIKVLGQVNPGKKIIDGRHRFNFWWWRYRTAANLKHAMGFHVPIACHEYDQKRDVVIDIGPVCLVCNKRL